MCDFSKICLLLMSLNRHFYKMASLLEFHIKQEWSILVFFLMHSFSSSIDLFRFLILFNYTYVLFNRHWHRCGQVDFYFNAYLQRTSSRLYTIWNFCHHFLLFCLTLFFQTQRLSPINIIRENWFSYLRQSFLTRHFFYKFPNWCHLARYIYIFFLCACAECVSREIDIGRRLEYSGRSSVLITYLSSTL